MFKNLKRKVSVVLLSFFVLSSTASFPVFAASKNSNTATIKPIEVSLGSTATIPLQKEKSGEITINQVIDGGGGSVQIVPTTSQVSWFITPYVPADTFIGHVSITDLNSNLGVGFALIYDFHGSIKYSGISGHRYRLSISGTAYLASEPTATVIPGAEVNWTC